MGYKRWLRLEEVTSDDLNDYLGSQVVCRFTNAAARAAAIPFPEDGQVSYLTGEGTWEAFDATLGAWVPTPGTPLVQASLTTDAGLPLLNSFGQVVALPSATYHQGRTYELRCPAVTIGNVTGATRGTVLRWERLDGSTWSAVAGNAANETVEHNTRRTMPASMLWTPSATFTGQLRLAGSADASMGATGGNGVLGSSSPVYAAAVYLGDVPTTAAQASDDPQQLPAPPPDLEPEQQPRKRPSRKR